MDNLLAVFDELKLLLSTFEPPLVPITNYPTRYELEFDKPYVTRSLKTGRLSQKHGMYFAGLIIQRSYVGLYFMPVYSHHYDFDELSPSLKRALKGKTCFHISKLDDQLKKEIEDMLTKGFAIYQNFDGQ